MPLTRKIRMFEAGVLVEELEYDFSWDQVRAERDRELNESDWRAVKDRTMSQAWKDYREALRTLPQRFDDPGDAVDAWPVMPDA